jgi:hypothetical protein
VLDHRIQPGGREERVLSGAEAQGHMSRVKTWADWKDSLRVVAELTLSKMEPLPVSDNWVLREAIG